MLNPGDKVRFAVPQTEDERAAVMTVIELRGPRVLVKDDRFSDWRIQPTAVYPAADLERIEDQAC